MAEITLGFLDQATGRLILDDELPAAQIIKDDLASLLGTPVTMGCANPTDMIDLSGEACRGRASRGVERHGLAGQGTGLGAVRVHGLWHNSLIEGLGRRSVVQFQGCPLHCVGCWVPQTWSVDEGHLLAIDEVADLLLDPAFDRDGITVLGGEPFAQPYPLRLLIEDLRERQPDLHITVYSGYTLQSLIARSSQTINNVLAAIDVLIDGPYVRALASTAGPWTGSGNQRIHWLR